MSQSGKEMKVLWAVDAFDDLPAIREKTAKILKRFAQNASLEIDPLYILNPSLLGVLSKKFVPEEEHELKSIVDVYHPIATKALQGLKNLEIPGMRAPLVMSHVRGSRRSSVEFLSRFANRHSYDIIVTGSHGRRGFDRLVLGSFAEELFLQSKIPVLVVGDHSDVWMDEEYGKPIHILVVNDFSDPSSPFFDHIFQMASLLGSKVTLLNVIRRPIEPIVQAGVYLLSGGWVSLPIFLNNEREMRMKTANQIAKTATRNYDVPCEIIIEDFSNSVSEAVLKHAKQLKVGFIAMASESGPLSSTLIGSMTRQVVRSAQCPVWVYKPRVELKRKIAHVSRR